MGEGLMVVGVCMCEYSYNLFISIQSIPLSSLIFPFINIITNPQEPPHNAAVITQSQAKNDNS